MNISTAKRIKQDEDEKQLNIFSLIVIPVWLLAIAYIAIAFQMYNYNGYLTPVYPLMLFINSIVAYIGYDMNKNPTKSNVIKYCAVAIILSNYCAACFFTTVYFNLVQLNLSIQLMVTLLIVAGWIMCLIMISKKKYVILFFLILIPLVANIIFSFSVLHSCYITVITYKNGNTEILKKNESKLFVLEVKDIRNYIKLPDSSSRIFNSEWEILFSTNIVDFYSQMEYNNLFDNKNKLQNIDITLVLDILDHKNKNLKSDLQNFLNSEFNGLGIEVTEITYNQCKPITW